MAAIYRWIVRAAVQRAVLALVGIVAVWWLLASVERATGSLQASVATIVEHREPARPTWHESGGGVDIIHVCGFGDGSEAIYAGAFLGSSLLSFAMAIARRRRAATSPGRRML
jgi:hypothetical protein